MDTRAPLVGWVPVSREEHGHAHFLQRRDFGFTQKMTFAGVVLSELPYLLPHYVLAFVRHGSAFAPVALLGGGPVGNVYLNKRQLWRVPYSPASVRGYPFALGCDDAGEARLLGIMSDHLCEAPVGDPLFQRDGALSETVEKTLALLQELRVQHSATEVATRRLRNLGLIQPWRPVLEVSEETVHLGGLYRIDLDRLNSLPADQFTSLQGAPLMLAHAQHLSEAQLPAFNSMLTEYAAGALDNAAEPDLDYLFGDDADTLHFQ